VVLAVNTAEVATPLPFVVAVFTPPANVPPAPLDGAVKVTVAPLTGLLPASFTVATSGAANAVLIVALCGVPLVAVMLAADPALLVSEKFAGAATPATVAVTVYDPAVAFAVKTVAVATPLEFVVAVLTPPANVPLAPLEGAVNVTTAPLTGLLPASFTVAWNCVANAALMVADWGVPAVAVTLAGAPAVFVREKFAGEATPATAAVTVYEPAVPLAVNTAAVATPLALVVAVLTPPAKVPLAPLDGAANITVAPLTAFPPLSFTVACNCTANAVLTAAFCGVPAVAVIEAAAPGLFVSEKLAGLPTPATVAVTV